MRTLAIERLENRCYLAAGPMSVAEQHLHELVNWARSHPVEASQRYEKSLDDGLTPGTITTDPKPPLARNDMLRNAISDHVQELLRTNTFSHTGADGSTSSQRMQRAGYTPYRLVGENLAWWGIAGGSLPELRQVADNLMKTWFQSATHRKLLMNPNYQEVGTALVTGPFTQGGVTYNAGLSGQDFGKRDGDLFLTGLGCRAKRTDLPICDVSSPITGATVTATRTADQMLRQATTGPTGEYDIALPTGTWDVHIEGGGLPEPIDIRGIVLSNQNVKLDFQPIVTTRWRNPRNSLDVNNDGRIAPNDVLAVVNELNASGAHALPYIATPPALFLDCSGDNFVSPADALAVINSLNAKAAGEAEFALAKNPAVTPSRDRQSLATTAALDAVFASEDDLPRASAVEHWDLDWLDE